MLQVSFTHNGNPDGHTPRIINETWEIEHSPMNRYIAMSSDANMNDTE